MKNSDRRGSRLISLGGFLVVVLLVYLGVLYNTQVVHGAEYLEQSVRTITKNETVEASRGIITDRNGQELVSNRPCYNLTFDSSLLKSGQDQNDAILRLIDLCRSKAIPWEDNLPISRSAPFSYTVDDITSTQKSRFLKYLQDLKLIPEDATADSLSTQSLNQMDLTADQLLSDMKVKYGIPASYSDTDVRAVLGVEYELSIRQLINTTAYVFAEDVDSNLISLLSDGDYAGVKVVSSTVREYETNYAAHILGTVGRIYEEEYATLKEKGYAMDDLVGKSGAESAFEDYLRGTDGTRIVSTNSEGKITNELYTEKPEPGDTVELTLDLNLQKAAEDALADTVSKMTEEDGIVRGAGAAVIQVGTGDILALASYPTFDLSTYRMDYDTLKDDPSKPLFNRATQGTYPPGSTFKPCTAVAALESGAITTNTKIYDKGIFRLPNGKDNFYLKCWIYPGSHGLINVSQAITVSCNYFFCTVGNLTGIDTIDKYATAFGLGQHTGIEIGDSAGILAGPAHSEAVGKTWYGGDTVQAAIGQSDHLFTPLQLANYIATLVGGGDHYDAHLLKTVKTYDNSKVVYTESNKPTNTVEMSDSTLEAVKEGMKGLTTGSLAAYFKDSIVSAGAKTGTAQLGKDIKNNGIFVCFAPYDNPQIAVAIVIEKGGSGSALASTGVKILNSYFGADEVGSMIIGENTLIP